MTRRPGGWPVIVIVGATGVGKTDVALAVANRLSGEVLSADSRQVYRDLCVGTAKPLGKWFKTKEGLRYVVKGVVHHLVDHVGPTETYTAGRFKREAHAVLDDLSRRNVPAVLVGGTGLYLRSLVRGLALLPEGDPVLRKALTDRAEKEGRVVLHQELQKVDPVSAHSIPPNNIQRVIRALEVHEITGRPLSLLQKEGTHPAPWDFSWFGLRCDPVLYEERLKQRCRFMVDGILEETKALLGKGVPPNVPAFQSLGYREALAYESNKKRKIEFEQELYQQTRLYAKRQLTWFRREPGIFWLDVPTSPSAKEIGNQLLSHLSSSTGGGGGY